MTDNIDGLFYSKPSKQHYQNWEKDTYRLEPVTSASLPGSLRVPPDTDGPLERRQLPSALIVVGERRSGMSAFLQWLRGRPFNGRGRSRTRSEWRLCESASVALDSIAPVQGGKSVKVILDRTQPSNWPEAGLAQIAGFIESDECRTTRSAVVVATHEVASLRSDAVCSAVFVRGQAFRLPHFDPPELEAWVNILLKKKKAVPRLLKAREEIGELARVIKSVVGGQPFLTHMAFRSVDDELQTISSIEALEQEFRKAGDRLATHPPHTIVDRWKQELLELLKSPPCRRLFEAYVAGDTKGEADHFPDEDALLFMAGWVGTSEVGRWGIRSQCHKAWGRAILRERAP